MCFLVGLLASAPVHGQEEEPVQDVARIEIAAEQFYQTAMQFYGQGRYREAVDAFDRSLALVNDPLVHCNRAVPLLRLDEIREARDSLRICRSSYPVASEDHHAIDAQIKVLTLVVDVVRPRSKEVAQTIAMGVARPAKSRVVVSPREPRLSGVGGSGIALLSVAVVGGVAAFVVDRQSVGLVEAFQTESLGGEGTSQARYDELAEEVRGRQILFYGVSAASIGLGVIGATMLGVDLFRVRRDRLELRVEPGIDGFFVHGRF